MLEDVKTAGDVLEIAIRLFEKAKGQTNEIEEIDLLSRAIDLMTEAAIEVQPLTIMAIEAAEEE